MADTRPGDMHWIIVRAIIECRLLDIYYEPGARIVEPCAYGLSRERHALLRAFQTAGASASGKHVNWKLLRTDRITQMHVLAARFDRPRILVPKPQERPASMRACTS